MKELLTLKTILPIIALTLMFGLIGQSIGDITEKVEEKPVVGIIDEDNSKFSRIVVNTFENRSNVVYYSHDGTKTQEALEKLKTEEGVFLLLIPSDFSENINNGLPGKMQLSWMAKGVGIMESIPMEIVNSMIQISSESISSSLIENTGKVDPKLALHPVTRSDTTYLQGKEFRGVSPRSISEALSLQSTMVPIVIMIIILMSGGQVITSMGREKGNKTLETLLTLPVNRSHIAIGKIIGSAIVGLLLASIYMVGFSFYMQSFQPATINLAGSGLALGTFDYLLLGLSLFLTILAGLSICMLMGTFAKNYESAQMLMFPLIILVFIPFFLSMFKSFFTLPLILKTVLFVIPFSHPMWASSFLMFDQHILAISGIIYVAIFTTIIMAIVSRIFKSDTLLTGRFEIKWIDKLLNFRSEK